MSRSIPDILKDFFLTRTGSFGIALVFLYGSRVRGIPLPDSDIDLVVIFEDEALSDETIFQRLTTIATSLTEMTGLEVNLNPIYSDFRKPMLYYNAIVLGVPVFIQDPTKYGHLRAEAIRQMEDFQLFGPQWLISITRRNLERVSAIPEASKINGPDCREYPCRLD